MRWSVVVDSLKPGPADKVGRPSPSLQAALPLELFGWTYVYGKDRGLYAQ